MGIALSPAFLSAIGPGDLTPDDQRFGILWMPQKALAVIFFLDGAFNSIVAKLQPGADETRALPKIDGQLQRYGGTGCYGRNDHVSQGCIDAELKQLAALARVMPPIILAVSAFLINMTQSRLIALVREQIGLFKALGYADATIVAHCLKRARGKFWLLS